MKSRIRATARGVDPWLVLAAAVAAALRFGRLGDFDNQYYTATVASMLTSTRNFLFASFDPGGVVTVDKPPLSFWVQAIPVALWGPSRWAVTLPQAMAGTGAVILLYWAIRRTFGRAAAVAAALVLAVVPASVLIDSRNEPDSLLSFTLLLAAFCVVRAAETGRWWWLVAFALLMGAGFNIKMLVAFIPLPAFLLYYVLAAKRSLRQVAVRAASAIAIVLVVSLSWVTAVGLTPPQHRPYIGSTRDNSIWTLVFEYNGLERFRSFLGPRPRPPGPQTPQVGQPPRQPSGPLGYGPRPPNAQPQAPSPPGPAAGETGLLGLFSDRLASQTGWLLPLALFMLLVSGVPLLPEGVYRRPADLWDLLRASPSASQTVLWGGWLLTAVVVFGLASATTTHPYYLVGLAVPMAAVMGIAYALLWRAFRGGNALAWLLPGALVGAVLYQGIGAQEQAGDWALGVTVMTSSLAVLVMAVAIWRKVTATPLAAAFVALGALAVLLLPAASARAAGGPIAGPRAGAVGRPGPSPVNPEQDRVGVVSGFIRRQGDGGSVFTIGAFAAREAAPFIIAGVPAVAIGGFSGSDPIFTVESFRTMAERGELRYFLVSGQGGPGAPGGPPGGLGTQSILDYVRREWEDVSGAAGLPQGTLYRYFTVEG
ncbi:MAG: glycosyltransferase family 39 protein [Chloroflexi bacterium]|nr:glycosyltransferase family 39 protein [Chloroflexota bacterium]